MKTADTKINIRIDKKTKDKAQKTLADLGLDLSSGVKLFLKSVIHTQSIPFEVRTKNGYTPAQERRMLKETKEALDEVRSGKGRLYSSASEMIQDISNWNDDGEYV